jgi:endonuclease/exonuclease/phosphatase family metal-dependent hydrolase
LIAFIKNELLSTINEKAIICLQELDFNKKRSGNKNFLKLLKDELGAEWNYYYFDPEDGVKQKYGIGIITNLRGTKSNGKPKEQKWRIYESGSIENRGAIAIKLIYKGNPIWIVNTHTGFINPASQIYRILERIYTFDTNVPVVICGDLNVADIDYAFGDRNKNHALYQQTIAKLERNGFYKSQIANGAPQSFHSWNSKKNGILVDYIMTAYPYSTGQIEKLSCYKNVWTVTPKFKAGSKTFYFSDHNAIVMNYRFL